MELRKKQQSKDHRLNIKMFKMNWKHSKFINIEPFTTIWLLNGSILFTGIVQ